MTNAMIIRYFYYLTKMNIGTTKWKECYEAWNKFGDFIGGEEYEIALKDLKKFNQEYEKNLDIPLDSF